MYKYFEHNAQLDDRTKMYRSAWEMKSTSSHPKLWLPPVVIANQIFPTPNSNVRLPSVNDILLRISRESTLSSGVPSSQQSNVSKGPSTIASSFQSLVISPNECTPNNGSPNSLQTISFVQSSLLSAHPYSHIPQIPSLIAPYYPQQIRQLSLFTKESTHSQESVQEMDTRPSTHSIPRKRGRKRKANAVCSQCGLTNTPEWRRGPNGVRTLCNACGLYYLKLSKKFGAADAKTVFLYKKLHNEVTDRMVPSMRQKQWFCEYISEQGGERQDTMEE